MPKVVIKKQTQASAQDAFARVKNMLSDDKDLKKLDPSYKCNFNDSTLSGTASGKMFKADMVVRNQGGGCEVEITVDLPLALTLAKGMVQKTLEKKLSDSLA
jgi:hypothetical protein